MKMEKLVGHRNTVLQWWGGVKTHSPSGFKEAFCSLAICLQGDSGPTQCPPPASPLFAVLSAKIPCWPLPLFPPSLPPVSST